VKQRRGFTLIELMISLVISTLFVIMILSIFSRMSFAYREQQQIVQVQQQLTSARALLERDAKQAGFAMSQGFKISYDGQTGTGLMHSPVRIENSSTAPDQIGFYYADGSTQALVTTAGPATTISVDSSTGFAVGDLVVLSTADTTSFSNPIAPLTDAKITKFDACVVMISTVAVTSVTFSQTGAWGNTGNTHCNNTTANTTMMYEFVGHYWRIDTAPAAPDTTTSGLLELSTAAGATSTANLNPGINVWNKEGYDFTDIQVATEFWDNDAIDEDGITPVDATRDWYSSTQQDTWTQPILNNLAFTPPIAIAISIVARTDKDVEGVSTVNSPSLKGTILNNNNTGDRASFALPSATDPLYQGKRIYRYITFGVELRDIGVGL
jgi:prepilin-type N-terminal cleavage/methylation domain-containing protein